MKVCINMLSFLLFYSVLVDSQLRFCFICKRERTLTSILISCLSTEIQGVEEVCYIGSYLVEVSWKWHLMVYQSGLFWQLNQPVQDSLRIIIIVIIITSSSSHLLDSCSNHVCPD